MLSDVSGSAIWRDKHLSVLVPMIIIKCAEQCGKIIT
jgi:hypothetical protein